MGNEIKLKLNLEKILVVLIVGFVFAGTGGAEDWPMFMHDLEHTGETSDVIKIPQNLELVWKFETGDRVQSSPSIYDDYIYFGSDDDYVYCLNKNTGELMWKFKTGDSVYSSPAVSGDYVYFGSKDNHIYCFFPLPGRFWQ